jgi:hypothetical protein
MTANTRCVTFDAITMVLATFVGCGISSDSEPTDR